MVSQCCVPVGHCRVPEASVAASRLESLEAASASKIAHHGSDSDDYWKRHGQEEDRDEGAGSNHPHSGVPKRLTADPVHGREYDSEDRSFQAHEEGLDSAKVAIESVKPRQHHNGEEARQHEEGPGNDPALRLVQEPPYVNGKLLGLGTGQQHAVVERVQEALLANPPFLLDEDTMHYRDLTCGSAER